MMSEKQLYFDQKPVSKLQAEILLYKMIAKCGCGSKQEFAKRVGKCSSYFNRDMNQSKLNTLALWWGDCRDIYIELNEKKQSRIKKNRKDFIDVENQGDIVVAGEKTNYADAVKKLAFFFFVMREHFNISVNQFSKHCGYKNSGRISSVLAGRHSANQDFFDKMYDGFDSIRGIK